MGKLVFEKKIVYECELGSIWLEEWSEYERLPKYRKGWFAKVACTGQTFYPFKTKAEATKFLKEIAQYDRDSANAQMKSNMNLLVKARKISGIENLYRL